jgi:hypothetical protein
MTDLVSIKKEEGSNLPLCVKKGATMETIPFHLAVEKYSDSINTIIEFNKVSPKVGMALKDISEMIPIINKYLDEIPKFNILQSAYLESFARWRSETPEPSYDRAIRYVINERLNFPSITKTEPKDPETPLVPEQPNKSRKYFEYLRWSLAGLIFGLAIGLPIISL